MTEIHTHADEHSDDIVAESDSEIAALGAVNAYQAGPTAQARQLPVDVDHHQTG